MFDSIIKGVNEKYDLGDKAGALVSAIFALMTDGTKGGFAGFIDRFREAGLGDLADSWISSGANTPVSYEQLESALGEDALQELSESAGLDYETTVKAGEYAIPHLVDELTPNGEIPGESDLRASAGANLDDGVGTSSGGVGTSSGGVGTSSGGSKVVADTFDRVDPTVGSLAEGAGNVSGYEGGSVTAASADGVPGIFVADTDNGGNDSPLSWLLPLIITAILVVLGYWFCTAKSEPVANVDANVNKTANANSSTNANAN